MALSWASGPTPTFDFKSRRCHCKFFPPKNRRHHRAVKFQLELAVEIEAEVIILAVTHWVSRSLQQEVVGNAGFSGEKAQTPFRNDKAIWEIRVYPWRKPSCRLR